MEITQLAQLSQIQITEAVLISGKTRHFQFNYNKYFSRRCLRNNCHLGRYWRNVSAGQSNEAL